METIEAIKSRRSIRKFKEDKIPHEIVEKVIHAAVHSPSWKNTQITRYIIVESNEIKKEIALNYVPDFNKAIILNAPMLLALSIVKKRSGYERDGSFSTSRKETWQMFDAGIASQTFCLAAHEFGLGTVIMGIFDDKLSEILDIPEDRELVNIICIGEPAESPDVPKRKSIGDLLSYL